MSGTFPSSPGPASIDLKSVEPTAVSTAHNQRRIRRSRGTQRWRLDLKYSPMSRAELAPILAFAMKQEGQKESFDYVPPVIGTPQGTTGSDNPLAVGAQSAGDTTIPTDTWSNSTLVMKAGDLVRFAGHSKTYMVTDDATTDGAGAVTLSIRPALVEALADNEALTVRSVPITCTFDGDIQESKFSPGAVEYQASLIETI